MLSSVLRAVITNCQKYDGLKTTEFYYFTISVGRSLKSSVSRATWAPSEGPKDSPPFPLPVSGSPRPSLIYGSLTSTCACDSHSPPLCVSDFLFS